MQSSKKTPNKTSPPISGKRTTTPVFTPESIVENTSNINAENNGVKSSKNNSDNANTPAFDNAKDPINKVKNGEIATIIKEDETKKEVTNKEVVNKEVVDKEVANKEVTNKEVVNKEVVNKEVVDKEVIDKEVIDKEAETNLPANSQAETQQKHAPAAGDLKPHNIAKTNKTKITKQHLYAGIIGGPDLSTIKFQKIIKTGFTGGIIVGYTLNKKWSIESGFYLDKKYYYTDGEYFSTKKIPLPSNIKIENANGYCNMTEVPLNIKYNFKASQKGNWFGIAGISSYFMKKEVYGYKLSTNGGVPWNHEYSYKTSSKNLASIVNLSAGYSYNIGKTGMFRIEPYIKIPFRGFGVGSLPIISSGVYLTFAKNLF